MMPYPERDEEPEQPACLFCLDNGCTDCQFGIDPDLERDKAMDR